MRQSMMNRVVAPLAPLFACIALSGAAPAARADEECTLEDLKGNFGGSFDAVVTAGPLAGPAAALTRLTLRADGSFTGTDVANFNGHVFHRTIAGTISLNADCTGTTVVTITSSQPFVPFAPVHVSFVVTNRLRDIRFIFTEQAIIGAATFNRQ